MLRLLFPITLHASRVTFPIFITALLLPLLTSCHNKTEENPGESPLQIIPIPREVHQAPDQPDHSLARGAREAVLVLPQDATERMRIAAREINLRLEDLGAPPLRISECGLRIEDRRATTGLSSTPQSEIRNPKSAIRNQTRIVLSLAGPADSQVPDAEQGYWIDSRDKRLVRLVGRDEQGLLWAAVTFRRMLVKGADGRIMLLSAEIRDWPDFAMRMMNRFIAYHRDHTERGLFAALQRGDDEALQYANNYVADSQAVVDFLVRLKHNVTWLPLYGLPTRLDDLSREIGGVGRAAAFLATLRAVTRYAQARGMAVCDIQMTNIGTSPEDDADPEVRRCVFHKSHKKYFCWSQDARSRRKAEETAKLYAAAGYSMVALHTVDGGGYADPALWNARCAECKARWGDDRAAADAHLYALWRDAFARLAPTTTLTAIQYPYDASILLQEDHANVDSVKAYWSKLCKSLPKDADFSVCVRENIQPAIAAFCRIFDTRPVLVYWMTDTMPDDHRWDPLFTSRVRFAQTFRRAGRRDWIFAYSSSCRPMTAIAGAQYLWDADSPGAGLWPGGIDVDRDGAEPAAFFDEMLPKFAAELFGPEAAPWLLDTFKGCISPSYCLLPTEVARMCGTANTVARMQQQYDALVRASGGLERLWQRLETGRQDVLRPGSEAVFYGLSEQVARARVWASYHLARMRAAEALRLGEPTAGTIADLEAAIRRVRADAAVADRMNARLRGKPTAGKADLNRWLRKEIKERYDDTAYERRIEELRRLRRLVDGRAVEPRDTGGLPVLPDDGQGVVLRGKGATRLSLVPYPTQGGSRSAIQVEGLTQPWHDGFSVGFPPVDVAEVAKRVPGAPRAGERSGDGRGVLRFYINGGGTGGQQLTFWLYARNASGDSPKPDEKDLMWVDLADYVAIDDLEATWQLVSIPLDRLLRKGYTTVVGFGMNDATQDEVCGPAWIDTMYVTADRPAVEREVAVQKPPEQAPATQARVLAIGVQPSTFVGCPELATGADGMQSRLLLGLKLVGDGSLSDVRITLRFLAPDGALLRSQTAVSAARLRTPWWSPSLRFDLGRLVPSARIEMTLSSREAHGTGSVVVRW